MFSFHFMYIITRWIQFQYLASQDASFCKIIRQKKLLPS